MSFPARTQTSSVDRENPWPGLESFNEDSRAFFFGREVETDQLSRLVSRQTLTVLFGQSGLGKSSLLQAGLFPILRESDHLPLYLRLDHAPNAADLVAQVKISLNAAFTAAGADAPAFSDDETLWEYFHRKDVDIWSAKNRLLTPVLAFDQFEEIFTLGRTDEACSERSRVFLSELACLVENRPPAGVKAKLDAGTLDPAKFNFEKPSCRVILSLREDFLPDLEGLRQEMPALIHNRLRLKKLNGIQALEVVSRPAPELLAEGVAEKIVEFVAGARGGSTERLAELDVEPPLLSVICRELNDRRRALGAARITADLVSGNRREILTDFYERSVADLPAAMREYVEDHLLTKSGFRDNVALETVLETPGVTRELVDTLVARRLLRIEDRLGVQRVELTHDVLAEVIRASRDARRERAAIEESNRQLEEQRAHVAATRRALVRARLVAVVAIVIMLFAAGSAVFGWINMRRAQAAEKQAQQARAGETKLREQAQANEVTARQTAYAADMNLAIQAVRDSNIGRALELIDRYRPQPGQRDLRGWEWRYLWQQTRSDAVSTLWHNPKGEINAVAVSADGKLLATGGYHVGGLIVWDLATREQVALLSPRYGSIRAAFSPTAPLLAFTGIDLSPDAAANVSSRLYLWNFATRQMVAEIPLEGVCVGIAFTRDGQSLVTSTQGVNGQLAVWRMPGGELSRVIKTEQRSTLPGTGFALSPEGTLAALGTDGGGVHVVDLRNGAETWRAKETSNTLTSAAFSPDGRILATGSGFEASEIHLWDTASGAEIGQLKEHTQWVSSLLFSPDGSRLYSTSADQTIRTWDVATRQLRDVMRSHEGELWRLALLPDGHTLVSGGKNGEVSFWDASVLHEHRERIIWPEPVRRWQFAAEGGGLITLNRAGQMAKWTGAHFEHKQVLLEIGQDTQATISNDESQVAARISEEGISIWDVRDKRVTGVVKTATPRERPWAFLMQGTRLLTYSPDDATSREWELSTNRLIQAWPDPTVSTAGGLSPDERQVVVIGLEGNISIRNLAAQQTTKLDLDVIEPGSVNFSADGKLFVIASYFGYVRVWNTANWKEVATLRGYRLAPSGATFSADGRRLVTTGIKEDAIKLWDTESWQDVLSLSGSSAGGKVGMSADGSAVAVSSDSDELQIWLAPSWTEINHAEKGALH